MNGSSQNTKWLHPNEVLKLQRFKLKSKQLQARINRKRKSQDSPTDESGNLKLEDVTSSLKRRIPFLNDKAVKRSKPNYSDESSDDNLIKLLLNDSSITNTKVISPLFSNITSNIEVEEPAVPDIIGTSWIPIDWSLKTKVRLLSTKPFAWNQKLKISEEASGITGFVRCLDNNSHTTLDTSPNAKFHQCCLIWQQPSLPWLTLFPRTTGRTSTVNNIASTAIIRDSLHQAWSNSLRSLFQLVRTRQCPYFYMCANNFTVIFRSAGICSYSEMNALVTPTTRGFRQLLQQEDIVFKMPLKSARLSDHAPESLDSVKIDEDESLDERWLEELGVNSEDIKRINCTQAKIAHKAECDIDNSEESLVLIEGMEVHGLYNFLMNSKSVTSLTGPTAGIPPTLLAPVAFQGATLSSLKVRENKVRDNDMDYFSIELNGPILPHLIHNLCMIHPSDQNFTATFANFNPTLSFSKVQICEQNNKENEQNTCGVTVFGQENLSDCGLNVHVLKKFCIANFNNVRNVECLKYSMETKTYTWS